MNSEDKGKVLDLKRPIFVMLPQAFVDLQVELDTYHQELMIEASENSTDFGEALGYIAAKVGVVLAGDYAGQDIVGILEQITKRLMEKRSVILLAPQQRIIT